MRRSLPVLLSLSKLSLSKLATLILVILIVSTVSFAAAPDRITGPIVSGQMVKLSAGVPMKAQAQYDRGPVDPSFELSYMTLLTVPSASQQKAISQLLAQQQDRRSPLYHKWLTPEQYADRFGLSQNDIDKITTWLKSEGFAIVRVARARNFIVFSGNAAQAERAFQVQIHNYKVNGEMHFSNTTPPMIPAALSGIVTGFHGLNNFRPKSQAKRGEPAYTFAYKGNDYFFLAPGDIAAIYDVNKFYNNGVDGTGQTLAVMGQTGIYQTDLTNFRQNFGLSPINCTTTTDIITACDTSNFKYILVNGTAETIYDDPTGEDDLPEADLDIEWSGATAKNATVIFVTATDATGGGVWDSWYYAVDNIVAPVITMSYGSCEVAEASNGASGEGTFNSDEAELQQANMEGITFLNSAGDTGAAECDDPSITDTNIAINGYAVAYPASSQYVTGVGGTSIPAINPDNEYSSTYWNSSNGTGGASAKGYIPEQPWNDAEEFGMLCTVANPCTLNGVSGVDSWLSAQEAIGISASGGGVSNCFTIDGNGVCTGGFPRPSWQSGISASAINPNGFGVTSSPARYSPDVSLLASPNFPGYLICTQEAALGGSGSGSACDSPTTGISDMLNACEAGTGPCSIYGGTSVSTPIFAGMVTLLNQYLGANGLSNINSTLYTLAAANSTNHAFNPVTTGTSGSYSNGAWCEEGTPASGVPADPWPPALQCPSAGVNAGFLGFNAYDADPNTNYNLVTGLGSVDAYNLAQAWAAARPTPTVALAASPTSVSLGQSVTLTATISPSSATGVVTFKIGNTTLGSATLSSGVASISTSSLPVGNDTITASYPGDGYNGPSSGQTTVNVTAPTFTFVSTNGTATSHTVMAGQTTLAYSFTATPTSASTFAEAVTLSCSSAGFSPTDPTLTSSSCAFSPSATIAAGSSASTVTMTIATAGPNTGTGSQLRHRADKRSPWLPLTLPIAGLVMLGLGSRKVPRRSAIAIACVSLALVGFMVACGGSSSSAPPPISVTVTPSTTVQLYANETGNSWPASATQQQFSAVVNNSTNQNVTWSVAASADGTVSSTGLYTTPATVPSPATITVTATAAADATKSGTGTVDILTPTAVGTFNVTVTAVEGSTPATPPAPTVTLIVQ
jgi:hypothetical protein